MATQNLTRDGCLKFWWWSSLGKGSRVWGEGAQTKLNVPSAKGKNNLFGIFESDKSKNYPKLTFLLTILTIFIEYIGDDMI